MLNANKLIGGECFYVRDCYVWAEIKYLDSATNYREFLPVGRISRQPIIDSELRMLDSPGNHAALKTWTPVLALFVVSVAIIGWLLYS